MQTVIAHLLAGTFDQREHSLVVLIRPPSFSRPLVLPMTKLLFWMRGSRLLLPWFLATSLPAENESFEVVETPASKHSLAPNLSSLGDHFMLSHRSGVLWFIVRFGTHLRNGVDDALKHIHARDLVPIVLGRT